MKLDYVCKICNTPFTWANQLSIHLKKVHNETCQTYYDKFLYNRRGGRIRYTSLAED